MNRLQLKRLKKQREKNRHSITQPTAHKVRNFLIVILATNIIFTILLFDPKLFTGGDNAHYISLAKSLLSGQGYRDIFEPEEKPHTLYPPGFPLLLIPGLLLFGENFTWLKLIPILSSIGSCLLFYLLLKKRQGQRTLKAFLPVSVLAVSPLLLEYSHWILSEVPYLFFSLLTIYLFDLLIFNHKKNWSILVIVGFSLLAVFFLRTVGITLILSVLFYLLYKKKWREFFFLLVIVVVFIGPWQLRNQKVGETGYLDPFLSKNPYEPEAGKISFSEYLTRSMDNLKLYSLFVIPQIFVPNIRNEGFLIFIGLIFSLFIILGLISQIKKKQFTIWEIYTIIFILITISWPKVWSGDRFFLPILPFLIYYLFVGTYNLGEKFRIRLLPIFIFGVILFTSLFANLQQIPQNLSNLAQYFKGDRYAGYSLDWQRYFEALAWIKDNTESDAVIVSRKPPFTYLLGKRKSFLYLFSFEPQKVLNDLIKRGADYILFDSFYWTGTTRKYLGPVLKSSPEKFELVYKTSAPEMYLFKLKK